MQSPNRLPSFPQATGPVGFQVGDYFCINQLGHGSYGDVYKGVSISDPNLIVALKVVSKIKIQQQKSARVKAIRQKLLKSEVEIMMKLKSEHIVRCYDAYENDEYVIMALEYCNGGDLSQEIKKRGRIPEEEAVRILKHIIVGFAAMHKHNIIHRDLKSENIFKNNEKYKLGDFGFAKIITGLNDISMGTTLGTLMTMAPQVMNRRKYGIKADIWSLGIVFYQMIFGCAPYKGLTSQSMMYSIKTQQLDLKGISPQTVNLLKRMLVQDPQNRISWTDLYKQPLLYKYSQSAILEEYQEDVELEESKLIHEKLEQKEKENDMMEEMDKYENQKEATFGKPTFKKMESKKAEDVQKNTKNVENSAEIFKGYIDRLNFERQKSTLILEQIIEVIDDQRIQLNKDRKTCQFLFLLSSRCFFIVSRLNDALKRKINIYKWQYYNQFLDSSLCSSFIKDFKYHYQSVKNRHKSLQQQVLGKQTQGLARISDFFWKHTNKQSYQTHDRFLCGLQNIDFTAIQQIRYTTKQYLHTVKDRVDNSKGKSIHQKLVINKLRYYLDKYYDIATAEYEVDRFALVRIVQEFKTG